MNYQLHYLIITNDPLDVIEEGEELSPDGRIEREQTLFSL